MREANLLDQPMYSPTLTARLVGLRTERVRRWLRGYEYTYTPQRLGTSTRRHQKAVVRRGEAATSPFASFLDLIDLLFVKRFVEYGLSIQRLRQALAEADRILDGHHFAQRRFWTEGRNIYLEIHGSDAEALLELLSGGQWAIAPIIKQGARQIDFDELTGLAGSRVSGDRSRHEHEDRSGGRLQLDPVERATHARSSFPCTRRARSTAILPEAIPKSAVSAASVFQGSERLGLGRVDSQTCLRVGFHRDVCLGHHLVLRTGWMA